MADQRVQKDQTPLVISKTYDLMVWTVNHTSRFPRSHRYALGLRLENTLYQILDLLIEARFSRERRQSLLRVNQQLESTRYLLRLAQDVGCLKVSSYGFAVRSVDEIGRLTGGWLKQGERAATV